MLTIQESFKRFREQFHLSKTDVCRTLNIKLPSYSYETEGKPVYPNGSTLIKLATTYNVSTDYLLGLTDNPNSYYTENNTAKKLNETNAGLIKTIINTQETLNLALQKLGVK